MTACLLHNSGLNATHAARIIRCAEFCARGSLYDVLRRGRRDAEAAAQLTWRRRLGMVGERVGWWEWSVLALAHSPPTAPSAAAGAGCRHRHAVPARPRRHPPRRQVAQPAGGRQLAGQGRRLQPVSGGSPHAVGRLDHGRGRR